MTSPTQPTDTNSYSLGGALGTLPSPMDAMQRTPGGSAQPITGTPEFQQSMQGMSMQERASRLSAAQSLEHDIANPPTGFDPLTTPADTDTAWVDNVARATIGTTLVTGSQAGHEYQLAEGTKALADHYEIAPEFRESVLRSVDDSSLKHIASDQMRAGVDDVLDPTARLSDVDAARMDTLAQGQGELLDYRVQSAENLSKDLGREVSPSEVDDLVNARRDLRREFDAGGHEAKHFDEFVDRKLRNGELSHIADDATDVLKSQRFDTFASHPSITQHMDTLPLEQANKRIAQELTGEVGADSLRAVGKEAAGSLGGTAKAAGKEVLEASGVTGKAMTAAKGGAKTAWDATKGATGVGKVASQKSVHALKEAATRRVAKSLTREASATATKVAAKGAWSVAGKWGARAGAAAFFPVGTIIAVASILVDPMIWAGVNKVIDSLSGTTTPELDTPPSPPEQFLALCNDGNRDPAIRDMDALMVKYNDAMFTIDPNRIWPASKEIRPDALEQLEAFPAFFDAMNELMQAAVDAADQYFGVFKKWDGQEPLVTSYTEKVGPVIDAMINAPQGLLAVIASEATEPTVAVVNAYNNLRDVNIRARELIAGSDNITSIGATKFGGIFEVAAPWSAFTPDTLSAADFGELAAKISGNADELDAANTHLSKAMSQWQAPAVKPVIGDTGTGMKTGNSALDRELARKGQGLDGQPDGRGPHGPLPNAEGPKPVPGVTPTQFNSPRPPSMPRPSMPSPTAPSMPSPGSKSSPTLPSPSTREVKPITPTDPAKDLPKAPTGPNGSTVDPANPKTPNVADVKPITPKDPAHATTLPKAPTMPDKDTTHVSSIDPLTVPELKDPTGPKPLNPEVKPFTPSPRDPITPGTPGNVAPVPPIKPAPMPSAPTAPTPPAPAPAGPSPLNAPPAPKLADLGKAPGVPSDPAAPAEGADHPDAPDTPVDAPETQPDAGGVRPDTKITRDGVTYDLLDAKAVDMANALNPQDGEPAKSWRDAAQAAGFSVPPTGAPGAAISPVDLKPGDVVIGDTLQGVYVGDGKVLTSEGIKPIPEVAHFSGPNQGFFRLDGGAVDQAAGATGQAAAAQASLDNPEGTTDPTSAVEHKQGAAGRPMMPGAMPMGSTRGITGGTSTGSSGGATVRNTKGDPYDPSPDGPVSNKPKPPELPKLRVTGNQFSANVRSGD